MDFEMFMLADLPNCTYQICFIICSARTYLMALIYLNHYMMLYIYICQSILISFEIKELEN